MEDKVFILCTDTASFTEISVDDLEAWKRDGSISEGDLIVFPSRVELATKTLIFKDINKQ